MEIRTIVNSLIDLFFPMRCIHCSDVIASTQILCVPCSTHLPYTHWELNQNNKAFRQLYQYCRVEAAYSLLHFSKRNVTQSLLHEMKYKARPEIGALLAAKVNIDLSGYDGIIPVPLHPKRLKQRRYNQVADFTKKLAEIHSLPYLDQILIRNRFNSSQVFKNKRDRIQSLNNAFQLLNPEINGHYIIVDDLITTGATLSQAIVPFNANNGVKVSVITIACA